MPRDVSRMLAGGIDLPRPRGAALVLGAAVFACAVWWFLFAAPGLSLAAVAGPAASQPVPQTPAEFYAWYQQQIQSIDPKDSDRLYRLAVICWTNKHPDQTAEVARRILATWPNNARAKTLLHQANQQLAALCPTTGPALASRPAGTRPAAVPGILTAEAINRIRFAEFAYQDMQDRPQVSIPPAVVQEFLDQVGKTQAMTPQGREQFRKSENDDRLRWIILYTGFQFADRIQVKTEPRSLNTYRQKVWPIISKNCALPTCHGGDGAGKLRLITRTTLPAAGATNFYTLTTFEGDDGRVINREQPEASLLLQYGLAPDLAEWKHPVAIQPLFTLGTNDGKYRLILNWIRSLRTPAPEYQMAEKMWQPVTSANVSSPVAGASSNVSASH